MTNISREDRINWDKPRQTGPLTEEDIEQRLLVRDIMSRQNFNDVKISMAAGRRRFTSAHEAQGGGARPGVLIAHSEAQRNQIIGILEDLRKSTQEGSTRMNLIDKMLAEFGVDTSKLPAGTQPAKAAVQNDPEYILGLSDEAKALSAANSSATQSSASSAATQGGI